MMMKFVRRPKRLPLQAAVLSVSLAFAVSAAAQTYQFTRILNGTTARPDGEGQFNIGAWPTTPAFDGTYVVFRDPGPLGDSQGHVAIWSYQPKTSAFLKLADYTTHVPGRPANTFIDFQLADTAPQVRAGTVVFAARDSSGVSNQALYAMPAAGGAMNILADYVTPDPSGGMFTLFDNYGNQMGAFSFDGATAAFNAYGSIPTLGNYSVKVDGTGLSTIADILHPFKNAAGNALYFTTPVIRGNNIVMSGATSLTLPAAYQGLFLGTREGNGVLTELVNSTQKLPGNTNGGNTRFDIPVLAMDGTMIVFRAEDASNAAFFGLYTTDLTSHTITKLVDVNSTLPGLSKLSYLATGGVAVNQAMVLFRAGDTAGASGLFLWSNGQVTRVIGTGDALDGSVVQSVFDPGPNALAGGSFPFIANVGALGGPGMYLAKPASGAMLISSVGNGASYATTSVAAGEVVTVYGYGLGPSTLATYQWVNDTIPGSLAGTRLLFNGTAAPLLYTSYNAVAGIVPFNVAGSVTVSVQVEYNNVLSPKVDVPVTNTMPALFSVDYSGSGQGAITYQDGAVNNITGPAIPGEIVTLWLAGLGAFDPPVSDGAVVPGPPWPTLRFPIKVTIGGINANILYQGPAPLALAGLYQVNCEVPIDAPAGSLPVIVTADGKPSQPNLTIAVQ
jgi:uncharacterized protein (TIGR03437 family)